MRFLSNRKGEFMKTLITMTLVLFSVSAFALSFVTVDDVKAALNADVVIEVDVDAIAPLVVGNAVCEEKAEQKPSRAYVVENSVETALYVTSEDVDDLSKCVVLYTK